LLSDLHGPSPEATAKYAGLPSLGLTRAIVRKVDHSVRAIGYALNGDSLGALPHAMLRVVMGVTPFIRRLKEEDPVSADAYIQSAFAICRLAADVALLAGDEGTAGWATGH
jgi:hypothetical protein